MAEDVNKSDMGASQPKMVLSNVVLAYIAYASGNSAAKHVANACAQHFSTEEIVTARNTLWAEENKLKSHLPEMIKRRNLTSMKGAESTVEDIIAAMGTLSEAKCKPNFVIHFEDLHGRLPLSKPAETCPISICERLSKLESRMQQAEALAAEEHSKVADLDERLRNSQTSYANAARTYSMVSRNQPMTQRTNSVAAHKDGNLERDETTLLKQPFTGRNDQAQSTSSKSEEDDGFTTVLKKKRRAKVTKGTGEVPGSLLEGAPEPSREIFVFRLTKNTTEAMVTEHMEKLGIQTRGTEKVSHEDAQFASFKVTVKASDLKTSLDQASWPPNVCVRRYYSRKQQRNADTQDRDGGDSDSSSIHG